MILKSIHLRNIRSYTDQQIDFPEGSVLLSGDIGSGKSTILHAAEFALFGLRRDSLTGDSLLRNGARTGDVELCVEIDGMPLTIRRSLKRQNDSVMQDTGHILIDGMRDDGTATELRSRIISILGYPKDTLSKPNSSVYRYTVYTPQEEMKHILFDDPEGRIDTLRKIFGIDKYKRVSENSAVFMRWVKEKKRELSGMIYDLDEKNSLLRARVGEFEAIQARKSLLLPVIDELREKKRLKKVEFEEAESKVRLLTDARRKRDIADAKLDEIVRQRNANNIEIADIDHEISHVTAEIEKQKSALSQQSPPDVEEMEKEAGELEKELEFMSSRKATLDERKEQVMRRIVELQSLESSKKEKIGPIDLKEKSYSLLIEELKDKALIEKEFTELDKHMRESDTKIAALSAVKTNSETLKSNISSLSKCPTCLRPVDEGYKKKIIATEDEKISNILSELTAIRQAKEDISKKLESLSEKMTAVSSKEKELTDLKSDLSGLKAFAQELDELSKRRKAAEEEKSKILMSFASIDERILENKRAELESRKALIKGLGERCILVEKMRSAENILTERSKRKTNLAAEQDRLKDAVKKINVEKFALKESLEAFARYEPLLESVKNDLELLAEEEMKKEVVLAEINKEIEGIEKLISALKKEVDEKLAWKGTLTRLTEIQQWVEDFFLPLMSTIEKSVFAQVHGQFSELFAQWFASLIADEGISVRLDDTFAPLVTQNGYDIELAHLSGGEKTAIALAYRLSLNKVINGVIDTIKTKDIIILDEPTDGFSSEQLDRVRDILPQLGVKQMIIVSHESKIESFVDHVIRVAKTDHVSRVVS